MTDPGGPHVVQGGVKKNFSKFFFFVFWVNRPRRKRFREKKNVVGGCRGELGASEGPKTMCLFFHFFFGFLVNRPRRRRFQQKKFGCLIVFAVEFEPSAAVGFRSRVVMG